MNVELTLAIFGALILIIVCSSAILSIKALEEKLEAYKTYAENTLKVADHLLDTARRIEIQHKRIAAEQKIMLKNVNMFLQGEERKARTFGQQDIWGI